MKSLRTVRYSLLAAAVVAGAAVSAPASAEVSATLSVASAYLWRGQNLGGGTPVVAGSLDWKHDTGLFAGVWTSSAGPANEVDLYTGYSGKAGDLEFTGAVYYYAYPKDLVTEATLNPGAPANVESGEFKEVYLSAGMAGFKGEAYIGVGDAGFGDNKDNYIALSYTMDKFTGKVGNFSGDFTAPPAAATTAVPGGGDYTHLDVTYAYSPALAFTLSKVLATDAGPKGDPQFVVSYAVPLK